MTKLEWRMRAADDWHIHLRNDERTPKAIEAVRRGGTTRVMAMPNTKPAIRQADQALAYQRDLQEQGADFDIHTTIELTLETTPEHIRDAVQAGVLAGKQYPLGVTTNSDDGVRDPSAMYPVYEAMQAHDFVLSLHGEVPGAFVMDAEAAFLESLVAIHRNFPKLRIVLEHITTAAAVETVAALPDQIAATITDHHLAITLDDVVGSRIQPHHFCKPLAKRPSDLQALNDIVAKGHPSFFSGTDSAPHLQTDKECAQGCAGVFNSPYHLPFLAHHFETGGMLPRLEAFVASFGADFYRLPRNRDEVELVRQPWQLPMDFGPMVPFRAGHILNFDVRWITN